MGNLRRMHSFVLDVMDPGKEYTLEQMTKIANENSDKYRDANLVRKSLQMFSRKGFVDVSIRDRVYYYSLAPKGIASRPFDVQKKWKSSSTGSEKRKENGVVDNETIKQMGQEALPALVKRIKQVEADIAELEGQRKEYWPDKDASDEQDISEDIRKMIAGAK